MSSSIAQSKLFALARQSYAGDYLGQRHFLMTLAAAFLLHLMAFFGWYLMPHMHVIDVPVRALNIKLGDDDTISQDEIKALQPNADNSNDVENTISRLVRDADPVNQARSKSVVSLMDKTMSKQNGEAVSKALDKAVAASSNDSNIAHQFVRANAAPGKTNSITGGSSEKNAEMVSRYEQLISQWVKKFLIYPDAARAQGMQGETMVRLRIDRQGNIRYYILEGSTGSPLLDRAAIDMVRRANPVPAVPNDYPSDEIIEFLIPVSFHLQ